MLTTYEMYSPSYKPLIFKSYRHTEAPWYLWCAHDIQGTIRQYFKTWEEAIEASRKHWEMMHNG